MLLCGGTLVTYRAFHNVLRELQKIIVGKPQDTYLPNLYRWKETVLESNPDGGEIFRTRPGRRWDPISLLYKEYRVFPGLISGRGVTLSTLPSSAVVKKGES